MKNSLITICLLFTFQIAAQESVKSSLKKNIVDTIRMCDNNICQIINQGNTRMGHIGITNKNKQDFEKNYKKNINKSIRHQIDFIQFKNFLENQHIHTDYAQRSRFTRKNIIRNFVRDSSKVFAEANFLMNFIGATDGDADKDFLRKKLEKIDDFRTVSFLLDGFDSYYYKILEENSEKKDLPNAPYLHGLTQNRKVITDYIDFLIHKNYLNYSQTTSPQKFIKGTSLSTDNDVFVPGLNEDKYYTGGVRFEIQTDFLKLNFLQNSFSKQYSKLSYQGLFWGIEVYTPYIRYASIENEPTEGITMDERLERYANDRPFASYEYLGVANYRIHHLGHKRIKTQYRFGLVGGERSENVQNTLHRDQTVRSVKVIGWDRQIGHPGRFGFNFDIKQDWMLKSAGFDIRDFNKEKLARWEVKSQAKAYKYQYFSGKKFIRAKFNKITGNIVSRKAKKHREKKEELTIKDNEEKKHPLVHIYSTAGLNIGNFLTAAETSLSFSTLSFKEKDGNNNFKLLPGRATRCHFTTSLGLRYVHHNPSLEGFGFARKAPFDSTEELREDYVIPKENVNRLVGFTEFQFGVRVRRTTFFYKLMLHTREVNNIGSNFFYGWGTIGMNYSNISLFGEND